jgi:predicted PurR-regulated permease PerM
VHARVAGRIRNPTHAALVSTGLLTLCILLSAVLLGRAIIQELSDAYEALSRDTAGKGGLGPYLLHLTDSLTALLQHYVNLPRFDLRAAIQSRLGLVTASVLTWIAGAFRHVALLTFQTVIAFVTLFYLFRGGVDFWQHLVSILPLSEDRIKKLAGNVNEMIIAIVYGTFSVAAAQGILTGLAFWALGVPSPVLWGLATSAFSVVPLIGSAGVWLPASVILIAMGAWWKGIVLLGWGAGVVGLIDNVIRPLIITGRVKLSLLYVLVGVLGGIRAFGLLGLFFGPIILSVTLTLLRILDEERRAWQAARVEADGTLANRSQLTAQIPATDESADGSRNQPVLHA